MSMPIIIYVAHPTPRVRYAWEVVFRHVLRVEYQLCSDLATYRNADGCKINYSKQRQEAGEVLVPAGNLLFESRVRPQNISLTTWQGIPAFFTPDAPVADIPFDLPAAVFYLVSRYEEYLPFTPDAHGRFPAKSSFAYQNNFLKSPIVNDWCLKFYKIIQKRYPRLPGLKKTFRFQPTFDIDIAWAYRYKGILRSVAAAGRSFLRRDLLHLKLQFQTLSGTQADPFDQYHFLENIHQDSSLKPIYFFLLGNYSTYDKNISHRSKALRRLIRQLDQKNEIGIHPSYRSDHRAERISQEKKHLENILEHTVERSRQHYLRLRSPDTYRALLQAGIRHDYTMGYADAIGFRAGIATPFPWYDLEREQPTELMIHPFQVMDATLRQYLKLTPSEAIAQIQNLIETTRNGGGTFTSIWHNSSLSPLDGWSGWREVYEALVRLATAD